MLTELETNRPGSTAAVPCRDVAHRRREVFVTPLPNGRVMVMIPPGEVAEFELEEVEELRAELRSATIHATVEPRPAMGACGSFSGTIPCSDAMGRERAVTVTTRRGGRVAVAAPPGGVAIFWPPRVGPFRAALRKAIGDARIGAVAA